MDDWEIYKALLAELGITEKRNVPGPNTLCETEPPKRGDRHILNNTEDLLYLDDNWLCVPAEEPIVSGFEDRSRTARWKKAYTPYKRMTHFKDHVQRVLCCRGTPCPQSVVDTVASELSGDWTRRKTLWNDVRLILRKHYSKAWPYYPNIYEIIWYVSFSFFLAYTYFFAHAMV